MLIIYALPEEYLLCSSRTSNEVPRTGILGHRRKKYNCHMHNEVEHITWYKGFSFPFRYKYLGPISTNYKIDILDTLVLKGSEILTPLLSRFAFLAKFWRIGILQGSEILTLIFIRKTNCKIDILAH